MLTTHTTTHIRSGNRAADTDNDYEGYSATVSPVREDPDSPDEYLDVEISITANSRDSVVALLEDLTREIRGAGAHLS